MDRITKSLLDEFSKEHDLTKLSEDKQFEHFSAYLLVNRFLPDALDTSEIVVGSGGDTGIDGIGIIINGSLVCDQSQIEECISNNGYLEVTFIFIQAERSSNFRLLMLAPSASLRMKSLYC